MTAPKKINLTPELEEILAFIENVMIDAGIGFEEGKPLKDQIGVNLVIHKTTLKSYLKNDPDLNKKFDEAVAKLVELAMQQSPQEQNSNLIVEENIIMKNVDAAKDAAKGAAKDAAKEAAKEAAKDAAKDAAKAAAKAAAKELIRRQCYRASAWQTSIKSDFASVKLVEYINDIWCLSGVGKNHYSSKGVLVKKAKIKNNELRVNITKTTGEIGVENYTITFIALTPEEKRGAEHFLDTIREEIQKLLSPYCDAEKKANTKKIEQSLFITLGKKSAPDNFESTLLNIVLEVKEATEHWASGLPFLKKIPRIPKSNFANKGALLLSDSVLPWIPFTQIDSREHLEKQLRVYRPSLFSRIKEKITGINFKEVLEV